MKKLINILKVVVLLCITLTVVAPGNFNGEVIFAKDTDKEYYTIYDEENKTKVIFIRGDGVEKGDEYISTDNKLYEIQKVDDDKKTGYAKFKDNVKMPVFSVKRKINVSGEVVENAKETNANTKKLKSVKTENVFAQSSNKVIGMYHTHNDECYLKGDGVDSVYGKGGIHDVGKHIKSEFEKLGITVKYSDSLHLPHNSGAYTRSQATASALIRNNDLDALFDFHRDATPRSEYITTVHGVQMSKVRMVVGSANLNYAVNKEFALTIKAYADEVYPGLIKDIYIGKGNYNQQLFGRAMLFEMGAHTIEKDLVYKSTAPLAKTLDVVLFGTKNASNLSMKDVDVIDSNDKELRAVTYYGLTGLASANQTAGNDTLWVILGTLGVLIITGVLFYIFDKRAREKINRFFSEITAGIFGKKRQRN